MNNKVLLLFVRLLYWERRECINPVTDPLKPYAKMQSSIANEKNKKK